MIMSKDKCSCAGCNEEAKNVCSNCGKEMCADCSHGIANCVICSDCWYD
jgi:hypothetical protein